MAEELGVKSFLWLQDSLTYMFRALSTGALGYWVYTYFTNSKYSFTYHAFLSGFQPNQFVINLERSIKAENHDISDEKLKQIDFFLRISAESAMVAQATKEKSFSLGTPTMFDSDKDISYHQYHTALTKRMNSLFSYVNSYPLSIEEKANIERILSQWDIIYENIPADFLYIVQTQCIHALGCPMLDWNRKLYLKEVYTFIKKFELVEDKKKFNKQSKILFKLMLNCINIDIDDQIEVLLDSEDGFSCIELVELTKKGDS